MKVSAKSVTVMAEELPSELVVYVTLVADTPQEHDILAAVATEENASPLPAYAGTERRSLTSKKYEGKERRVPEKDGVVRFAAGEFVFRATIEVPALRAVKVGGVGTEQQERHGLVLETDAEQHEARRKEFEDAVIEENRKRIDEGEHTLSDADKVALYSTIAARHAKEDADKAAKAASK